MVGAIIGWFFLGLLAVLVLAFVLPMTLGLEFQGGVLRVWVRVLFVRKQLLPAKKPKREKKTRRERKAKPAKAAEDEERQKPKRSFGETWLFIKRLTNAVLAGMKPVMRNLRVNAVQLALPVHADEAADTAVRVGQFQAVIGGALAALDGRLKVRVKKLVLIPDFAGQHEKALFFACKVCLNPCILFVALFKFLVRYLQKRPKGSR